MRTSALSVLSFLPFVAACASNPPGAATSPAAAHESVHTTVYYAVESNGEAQSPINIVTSEAEPGHHELTVAYRPSREHIANTGHTVKVTYDPGSSLTFDGKTYDLEQFHFHTPSEHLLDGTTYPLELHMVHALRGEPGKYLVVAVLFKQGAADSLIAELIAAAPHQPGANKDDDSVQLDVSSMFGVSDGYYHYEGSLTTPPYAETVTWVVSRRVHEASGSQIEALNVLEGNNARHIQALQSRHVDVN